MPYSITKPPVIVEPFCAQGTPGTDYIIPPQSGSATVQSQDIGWGNIYSTNVPPLGSGLAPTRPQFNGALNLYSSHDFWLQAGGTYTFEPDVSTACGGYPAGQVLYSAANNTFQLSLINNNTNNFNSSPGFLNDGVRWQQLTNWYTSYFNRLKAINANYSAIPADALTILQPTTSVTILFDSTAYTYLLGYCSYVVGGVGTLTLSLKNIDGTVTITIPPGYTHYRVSWDGSNWFLNGVIAAMYSPLVTNATINSATLAANFTSAAISGQPLVTTTTINNNTLAANFLSAAVGGNAVTTINEFAATQSTSGKIWIADNILLQWFTVSVASNTALTINYPVAFPNASLSVNGNVGSVLTGADTYTLGLSPLSATQFNAFLSSSDAVPHNCTFFAIGY